MAPKAAKAKSTMASIIRHEVVLLDAVSLAADSGWRDLDQERVDELVSMILDGNWGATSLAGPSLIAEGGKVLVSREDGKFVIFNGKHIVQALVIARERAASTSEATVAEASDACTEVAVADSTAAATVAGSSATPWVTDALLKIFHEGLLFAVYEFPDDYNNLKHQSAQALSHEEEQNKLFHTTLAQKAKLVRAYYVRERMDWGRAQTALIDELGQAKARTVARWLVLARDFSEPVLNHLKVIGLKSIAQGYVVGNKYLVGKAADARYRLSDEWAKVAFSWLRTSRNAGVHITTETFITEYCAPAKHAESWVRGQVQTFGVVATGFRAFNRAVEKLQSEAGRRSITTWLGNAELRQKKHFALEELVALVNAMQKTKAGTNLSAAGSTADPETGAAVPGDAALGAAGATALPEENDGDLDLLGESEPPVDPVLRKAESLAMSEMASISIHTDAATFADELKSTIYPASRPIVVVECPTSRQSTYFSLLDRLSVMPNAAAYGLLIPLGGRDELISGLRASLRKRFPSRRVDLVTLSVGKQTSRIRPSYVLYMPPAPDVQAPAHVGIEGCRARAAEGIRLRCTSKSCPFRTAGSSAEAEDAEIAPEDLEEPNFEACYDPAEADGTADDDVIMDEALGGGSDCKQNLFPFAAPVSLHARVLAEIGQASGRTHLVIMTRTAHPGLVLAARKAGLKVIAYWDGVSQHSAAHGQHLLKMSLTASNMAAAREGTPAAGGLKRVAASELQWQVVVAPTSQPVTLREVQPAVSNWRTGINCNPTNLDQKALRQVQAEMEACAASVALEHRSGLEIATAARSLREGDVVCNVGGLLFDSLDRLTAFFHSNACGKEFLGNILRIDGIQEEDPGTGPMESVNNAGSAAYPPPRTTSMYFVITGIGGFFRHYTSLGKQQPNVAFTVNVAAGACDGLVQVVVRTRNRCGVAAGSPLVLNFGMEFDHEAVSRSEAAASQSPKKLRTLLEGFFAGLGPREGPEAAKAEGESSAVAAAGAAALALADAAAMLPAPAAAAVLPNPAGTSAAGASGASALPASAGAATSAASGNGGRGAEAGQAPATAKPPLTLTLVPGEEVVAEIAAPLHLAVVDGPKIRLAARQPLEGNKKLPPRTVLVSCKDLTNKTASAGAAAPAGSAAAKFQFAFDKTKTTYVQQSGGPLITLHELIEKTGAKSIAKHAPWTGGTPTSLAAQGTTTFSPNGRDQFWRKVSSTESLAVAWTLKLTDKKQLTPTGIVAYTAKQLIIPASGTITLT